MKPNDLLTSPAGLWDRPELQADLVEKLARGTAISVVDVDAAEVLAQLLQDDFMAFGTDGGQALSEPEVRVVLRALRAVTARLGIEVDVPWRDFGSFKAYWLSHDGYGSWAARRHMVSEAFNPILTKIYALQDLGPTGEIARPAMDALPSSGAIKEHLKRLAASVDSDPRLAVSVAKDLVESTAKLILRERAVEYADRDDLPAPVARAQIALNLHAASVTQSSPEAQALKTILGSLTRLTQGVTELRNKVGVGHGRESVPEWVRPRHARLAAGAATTWCNLMLETLGDPDAPWRAGTPSL